MTPVQPLSHPHPLSNLSEDDDNDQNEDDSQGGGENPTVLARKDPAFDLDRAVDLESPFLRGILSDTQMPSTSGEDTTPTVTTGPKLWNHR